MAFVPGIRGTATAEPYPFTRTVSFVTRVNRFANATEQRWMAAPPLTSFTMSYASLLAADRSSQFSFFTGQKGMFDIGASITLVWDSGNGSPVTYNNMTLQADDFTVTTSAPLQYNTQISLRQTQNAAYVYTAPVSPVFPLLASGAPAMYPFTQTSRYLTVVNDQPTGMRYSEPFFGAGLSGFPAGPLKEWRLSFPVLTDADLLTHENFFLAMGGMLNTFQFTDPIDSSVHPKVRYGSDQFAVTYTAPNQSQLTLSLVETN